MKKVIIFFMIFVPGYVAAFAQPKITQEEFVAIAARNNPEIVSADKSFQALAKKSLELDTMYETYLNASGSYSNDRSGFSFTSSLQTKDTSVTSYSVGLSKKNIYGTSVSIAYTGALTNLDLYSPMAIPGYPGSYSTIGAYAVEPTLSVTQSLIKDKKNGQTQSNINKTKALTRAGQYQQLFVRQQAVVKARTAYLNLSLAREVINFRQSSLERASRVLDWTKRRVDLDLAENADFLQAQAGYKLRQLNLQSAQEDEVKAQRTFNEVIGAVGAKADYELEKISDMVSCCDNVALASYGSRADLLAAQEQLTAATLAEREASLRVGAEVSAFGSTGFSGLALDFSDANDQAFSFNKPNYTIGLMVSMPLGYSLNNEVRDGYRKDVEAAAQGLAKAKLSADNSWDDLITNWKNVKDRLQMARDIQNVQSLRVESEQKRFQRGRTTTFQVLNAENDLDDAMLNVYRIMFEELVTQAQAELFNTKPLQ
jgi:outer membrane protein TolC